MPTENDIMYLVASRDTVRYDIKVLTSSEEEAYEVWNREYPEFRKTVKTTDEAILLVELSDLSSRDIQILEDSKADLKVAAKNDFHIQHLIEDNGDCLEYYEPDGLMTNLTHVYIVHSDINENNIYAEFATEEEAIDYARRHKDELTYVDKVEVVLDEDGDILEEFDSITIWVYDEDEQMVESIILRNEAEQDEFFRLCRDCGFVTLKDLENFKVSAGIKDEDVLQALRDYKNSMTQNEFDIFQDEVECQNCGEVKRGRRTDGGYYVCDDCVEEDLDSLVEKMEENEDTVECKECFELFPKQDGFKIEVGYICPHCHASHFTVADEDTFKVDFPEYERMAVADDFVDYHTAETVTPEIPAESEPVVNPSEAPSPVTVIGDLVKDEEDAIAGYEAAEEAINATDKLDAEQKEEILDTIEHIKEEEQEHIEELEDLTIVEPEENENEPISTEDQQTLTEELEVSPEEIAKMEEYLKSENGQVLRIEDFTHEYNIGTSYYGDIVNGEVEFNSSENKFCLYLSVYHASEDNNAEYPERHTDEDEYCYDSLEDLRAEFPEYFSELHDYYVAVTSKLTEHVNEEHPAIESEQKLVGTDNAVVDCKVAKVITHSEDEKPVDCEGKKKPLEKPLTEATLPDTAKGGKLEPVEFDTTELGFKCGQEWLIIKSNSNLFSSELKDSIIEIVDIVCPDTMVNTPEEYLVRFYSHKSEKVLPGMMSLNDFIKFFSTAEKQLIEELTEETHAQFAKPEGNRIQAFNNALKYAKRDNADYIYGYINHTGKFFALEQPIKVKGDISTAEEQFRKQYKNCKVVYVAYPDKAFLKESLYNFTPEEMEEYGMDEEGCSVDGWDNFVRCNWCKGVYTEYECVFEADLGWLCPRCQEEIRYHGGPLTIKEHPSEEDIRKTLAEATKMTRDELIAKEGTDNVELINAGRPEEERVELSEYWWEDHDPMNWSDFDPIVYSVTYKSDLVGYVQFGYRGYDTYPSKEEIEKLIVLLLDDIDTIPEDYSMNDVDYELGDYQDMNDELPVVEEE